MSDRAEMRKKRVLSLDSNDEAEGSNVDQSDLYDDPEAMAKRRIVRVRRSPPRDVQPSLGGAFKALSSISPADMPALPTKLKFGASNDGSAVAAEAPPLTGETVKAAAPSPPFSLWSKTTTGGPTSFNFSFGLDKGSTETKSDDANNNNNSGSEAMVGKPLFGASFNFGNAVNSFIEAKKRIAEAGTDAQQEATEASSDAPTADDAFANSSPVIVSTGEVLACVPSKLFLFKSESKSWAECGAGDAKIKRHESTNEKDGLEKPKYRYRLIVRDGYALNAPLCDNFFLRKAEETHLIFAVPTDDKIATYLLRYTGPRAEGRGAEFSKILKETLKLTQKDST